MQTFTVYEPRPAPAEIDDRAAGLVFVKEGFALFAFLAPVLWLAFHRLWVEMVLFVALVVWVGAVLQIVGAGDATKGVVMIAINLVFGYEARDFYRRSLEARGYVLRAVVSGQDIDECERRFLQEWLSDAQADKARITASPGSAQARAMNQPVIGMFPAHGG